MSEMGGASDEPAASQSGPVVRVLPIINQKGLHARASAKFVQTVERFDADVRVTRGNETVGGTSIMGLMMLAAGPGTTVTVSAIVKNRRRARARGALAVALRRHGIQHPQRIVRAAAEDVVIGQFQRAGQVG